MNKYILCDNGIEFIFERVEGAEFNSIEVWLKFGSASDPEENSGLAHLIEHLLSTEDMKDVDLYAYYNKHAMTSKERIRLNTSCKKEKTDVVLEKILKNIMNFSPSEYYFEYQRQKVLYEILHLRKSPILLYLEEAEKHLFAGTGYDRTVTGLENGIKDVSVDFVRDFLNRMLQSNGMIISIAGEGDFNTIKSLIESHCTTIMGNHNMPDKINFKSGTVLSGLPHEGVLHIYDTYNTNFEPLVNFALNNILEEFVKYGLSEYVTSVKTIDHNFYNLFSVLIPKLNNYNDVTYELEKIISGDIDEALFHRVKAYVIEQVLNRLKNPAEVSHYNIRQYFCNRRMGAEDLLQVLIDIDASDFRKHLEHTANKHNQYKVISGAI